MENKNRKIAEFLTFRDIIRKFPTGILSVVSDTFDLWSVLTEYLPKLKEEILARDGKLVIRPDSGDPVDIICGHELFGKDADKLNAIAIQKGVVELLWDIFGGTINEQGYKVLDPHIGAIYGDSITLDRAEEICQRLKTKGFASTNIVLGVGSYSLGYATRDNQGGAVKSTYVERNGIGHNIFKNPITDDGTKKSAKGLLYVQKDIAGESLVLVDQVDWDTEKKGELKTVYFNGFIKKVTLSEIRDRISKTIQKSL